MKEEIICFIKNSVLYDNLLKIYNNVNFIICSNKEKILYFCKHHEISIVIIEDELDLLSQIKNIPGTYVIYFTQDQSHYLSAVRLKADDVVRDYSEERLKAISVRFYNYHPCLKTILKITVEGEPLVFNSQEVYVVEMVNRKVTLHTYYGTYTVGLRAFGKDKDFLYHHHFRQVRKGIYVNLMQIKSFKNNVVLMGDNSSFHLTRTFKSVFERDYKEVQAALMVKK